MTARRAKARDTVDLPQPLGPTIPVIPGSSASVADARGRGPCRLDGPARQFLQRGVVQARQGLARSEFRGSRRPGRDAARADECRGVAGAGHARVREHVVLRRQRHAQRQEPGQPLERRCRPLDQVLGLEQQEAPLEPLRAPLETGQPARVIRLAPAKVENLWPGLAPNSLVMLLMVGPGFLIMMTSRSSAPSNASSRRYLSCRILSNM
jgi:hypothetical protein